MREMIAAKHALLLSILLFAGITAAYAQIPPGVQNPASEPKAKALQPGSEPKAEQLQPGSEPKVGEAAPSGDAVPEDAPGAEVSQGPQGETQAGETPRAEPQAKPVGELELLKGLVKITRRNLVQVHQEPGKRVPVFSGDRMHVGANSKAKLFFRNERDQVTLYSGTLFTVDEVTPDDARFTLIVGKALFTPLSQDSSNNISVSTPAAIIHARGSEFLVASDGAVAYALAVSGVARAAAVESPGEQVILTANRATAVQPAKPPAFPVGVSAEAKREILRAAGTARLAGLPFDFSSPEEAEAAGEKERAANLVTEDDLHKLRERVAEIMATIGESSDAARPSTAVGAFGQ
ncbi:MAG: FecR domain-containing protein [SAR324 cluster bacterium]|nr:FecR domain-containing protein [SAR324 cluster bacterium]